MTSEARLARGQECGAPPLARRPALRASSDAGPEPGHLIVQTRAVLAAARRGEPLPLSRSDLQRDLVSNDGLFARQVAAEPLQQVHAKGSP